MNAVGYAPGGPERTTIDAEIERRGWQLVAFYEDPPAGEGNGARTGLRQAFTSLDIGTADVLVVAKLEHVVRSLFDFAGLTARGRRRGWAVVALDVGVDTTTPSGEATADVVAAMVQWERRAIRQQTRAALALKRAQGVRLGRPPTMSPDARRSIESMRRSGKSLRAIAEALNVAGVPTAQGGRRWYASTVRAALRASE